MRSGEAARTGIAFLLSQQFENAAVPPPLREGLAFRIATLHHGGRMQ